MNKKLLLIGRITGIIFLYSLVFFLAVYATVSLLVKGDEITAPDLIGKTLTEAYAIAAQEGIIIKKVVGDFGQAYPPNTVVNQFPAPDSGVKEKSVMKIFVASEVGQTVVPDLAGRSQKECDARLKGSKLKKGHVALISSRDVPLDNVIGQSVPAGSRIAAGSAVDLLISKGAESLSFVMPDLIGRGADKVLVFFETRGLKISKIEEVAYFGLKPGVILKQFPSPGFEISAKNLIGIQVSK
ncbi:MAG TPA: PASTA domain-containing protein [Candidatus Binatia bacterium]|nr:PASTA domain-containing protein [Candidatus Binatia bacterium]